MNALVDPQCPAVPAARPCDLEHIGTALERPWRSGKPGYLAAMRTVLIVDGYRDLVDSLAQELELNRWRVIGAHSIDEAKRVAQGIHIDVVLTDEFVVEGKGILVEDAFRSAGELKNTPFVYMVASPSIGRTLQGKRVLPKPFTVAQALDTLASATGHARPI